MKNFSQSHCQIIRTANFYVVFRCFSGHQIITFCFWKRNRIFEACWKKSKNRTHYHPNSVYLFL